MILGDRSEELRDAKVIPIIPDIAVEVLSPSETTRMIVRKLEQYFRAGVKEVWLIHPYAEPDAKTVEVWIEPHPPEQELAEE